MNIPRNEHPNPQWERKDWLSLNGKWKFDFDFSRSAAARKLYEHTELLTKEIIVPFCPESALSGIGYTDFMPAVVYSRTFELSGEQMKKRIIIHFGAVDYKCTVYVNSAEICTHSGGYTPFEADITDFVNRGENTVFVYAEDDSRNSFQCSGKQSMRMESYGSNYTRTTGIWQSVWLEFVPQKRILSAKYYTDPFSGAITVIGKTVGKGEISVYTSFENQPTGEETSFSDGTFCIAVKLSRKELWEAGCGRLYDLRLSFGEDTVYSYFGLRSVSVEQKSFNINGKTCFQRLVLDQGFYPDGIYTAPDDAALLNDIKISLGLGFNGARLHQKVFEPRFLYHCDRMGYMVWGEYPSRGIDYSAENTLSVFIKEWSEAVERDFNHPSIVCWCPLNETWEYVEREHHNGLLSSVYRLTKGMDETRPCIDASGNYHALTDIFDVHDYEQDAEKFEEYYSRIDEGIVLDLVARNKRGYQKYMGEALFMSEYGGIRWINDDDSWGYGNAPKSEKEFIERYKGLTEVILKNSYMIGFCYTQLYDIEQEKNGLYTYDRKAKFDPEIFKKINTAIER